MDQELEFTVVATANVAISRLDEEDAEVPGEHLVRMPLACANWPEDKLAAAVLDRFHECVAVNLPEDFDFVVLDPQGREISEF